MIIVFQKKLHSPRVLVLSNFAFTELVIFGSITFPQKILSPTKILTTVKLESGGGRKEEDGEWGSGEMGFPGKPSVAQSILHHREGSSGQSYI